MYLGKCHIFEEHATLCFQIFYISHHNNLAGNAIILILEIKKMR